MSKLQALSLAATLAGTVLCASFGLAQERPKPKDDALDGLLEKLENARDALADKNKSGAPEKPGDVAPKDKALDNLLEKLGQTPDTPAPEDRPKGAPGAQKEKPPGQPGKEKPKSEQLKGEDNNLDEHLEELTGRRRKKKQQDDGEGSGPLSKVIKEMRDVEQRLGKTDTGEETRKKQAEIVKNLETLIEQIKQSQSQSQGKKRQYLVMKPGTKPGQQDGQEQGATGKGVGASKPEKPTNKHALVGGEGAWGHLPPELRPEMMNVFKEDGLPGKSDWIRRYYLSVSKKHLIRGE